MHMTTWLILSGSRLVFSEPRHMVRAKCINKRKHINK